MADRDEAVQMLSSVTNNEDLDACRRLLEAHDWNLEAAVNFALSNGFDDLSQQPPPRNTHSPSSVSSFATAGSTYSSMAARGAPTPSADYGAPAYAATPSSGGASPSGSSGGPAAQGSSGGGGGGGGGLFGLIGSVAALPLRAVSGALSVASGALRFAAGYLPASVTGAGQEDAPPGSTATPASQFITRFELEYGQLHPPMLECSYTEALERSKRDYKFLIVYLHSDMHGNTPAFCRQTLASPAVIEFVSENFLFWAASISTPDAYALSNSLRASTYPFIAVIGNVDGRMMCVARLEGPMTPEQLTENLLRVIETAGMHLEAARFDAQERETARRIREEQDRAYQESLAADRDRERKRAEEERLRREEEERAATAEAARAEEERRAAEEAAAAAEAAKQARPYPPSLLHYLL
eukprot:tig00020571_g11484.t1